MLTFDENDSMNTGLSNFSSKYTSLVEGLTADSNVEIAFTITCEKHFASPALLMALTVYCPLSSGRAF